MNYENHKICQNIMILYVEAVIKIWEEFTKVVTYDAYKLEHLRKIKIVEKDQVRSDVNFSVQLNFHFKTSYVVNTRQS